MAIWHGFDVAGKVLEERVREDMERYQDGLQRHLLGLSLLNKKEDTVTKNEQDHFKQMIKVLDEFIEDAGALHPTQYDRISGVRALLAEMASEKVEEEVKWYRIVWEGPDLYFAGLVTEEGHPFWTRDPVQGQQYTIDRANEYLGKLKNVEGMMLDIRLVDDGEEEEAVKAGDFVGDGVKADTDVVHETNWIVKDLNDGEYFTDSCPPWSKDIKDAGLFDSKERIDQHLRHYNIKPEYIEVTVRGGKVEPVKGVKHTFIQLACGLKEIPKEEYFVIQRCGVFVGPHTVSRQGEHVLTAHDALRFPGPEEAFGYLDANAAALWCVGIWNGKPEVRKATLRPVTAGSSVDLSGPVDRPEDGRKYVIALAEDRWLHCDRAWLWTRSGLQPQYPRKVYDTRKEAEEVLGLMKAKNYMADYHKTARVEAVV
jgi:hypothetical protein